MPSAETMLFAYQAALRETRGRGQPGLEQAARFGKVIQKLLDLVNDDDIRKRAA